MIRFILTVVFLVLFLILSIPVFFSQYIIGKFSRRARDYSSLRIVQFAFKIILFICGTKLTILGRENVPNDQAVLYVGNHRSYFDIVISYSLVPGLTGYIAKKEMEKVPLLSTWMKYLYCLFIDRKDIKEGLKIILKGIDYVKKGISICIFPEGTRSKEDSMLPFKEGSLKIAEKTGCPIIPMALINTAEIFENHFPKIKRTHVVLEYGKPIYINELTKEEKKFLGSYTQNVIQNMIDKNRNLI